LGCRQSVRRSAARRGSWPMAIRRARRSGVPVFPIATHLALYQASRTCLKNPEQTRNHETAKPRKRKPSEVDGVAGLLEQIGARPEVDALWLGILHDRCTSADERLICQDDRVSQRRVDAEEAVRPDPHVSGNHDV